VFNCLFLLGIAREAATVIPAAKIGWYKFHFALQIPALIAGICFILEYAYPGQWLTRFSLILLTIHPIIL